MASKYLVAINQGGGMDGLHFISARDATSVSQITTYRQAAPGMVLDYTEAISKTGNISIGSDTITNITTSGISPGMRVYGDGLPRRRGLTVLSVNAGANTVQISAPSYEAKTGTTLYFATATQLYKANETPATGRNPAFHFNQAFFADTFNVPDTVENANKVKSAVIANIGPLRNKLVKNGPNGSIFDYLVALEGGGTRPGTAADGIAMLTSHNDQTSTWQANAPEGAIEGWGGGIADNFLDSITGTYNIPLASVSADGVPPFSAGTTVQPFTISSFNLVRQIPGYTGGFLSEPNLTVRNALRTLAQSAATTTPSAYQNDFYEVIVDNNSTAIDYQAILLNCMELTDPPAVVATDYTPTNSMGPANPTSLMKNLKQIARMILANNPTRGATATRSGNTVTIVTEVTTGVANRTAGSTTVTITSANHRLFTSTKQTLNDTDSVIVLGDGSAIDTSIPSAGYKITLDPSDPDNKFTFVSTQTTALVNAPVTIRLKHNLTTTNKVYIDATDFDTSSPVNGYPVASVIDSTSFTITTTASGAFTPATKNIKFKLINLPKQVLYTGTPGINWDSHDGTNEGSLRALNDALVYYNSLVERIPDADVVTFCITEFGRTIGVNSKGTDHGWGNNIWVFGKSVKGNRIYGTLPDYSATGPHVSSNMLFPTTSVYQYGATLAKWMGSSDAQILELFPDLANWPANERYLGFL